MIIQDSTVAINGVNGVMALVDPNNLVHAYRTTVNENEEIEISPDKEEVIEHF